ncbi:MAG: lamin tail domain-containing protein [Acidimicrobiia bacterium]|nr:lamin tail domain-containing protein [Acidimicrobiia bacterium]
MTAGPARRRVGPVIVAATALMTAGCGWGRDIGTGSKTDVGGRTEVVTDPASDPVHDADPVPVVVDRVVDGDSVELIVAGVDVELRLEGYNAPELYAENGDGAETQTCDGLAARAAVDAAVEAASTIELVAGGSDRFGRTLGDLLLDGESVVDRLIGEGYGLATGDDERRRALMVDAASAGLGVWGNGCGEPVSEDLTIGVIQVDAPGDDRYNLVEESVEVVNIGSEPIELAGWVLRDDTTGHRFPLPGTLAAGEWLTVITGAAPPGVARADTVYLGESFPVWSNDWETVILVDPKGVFADWRFVADGRVLLE